MSFESPDTEKNEAATLMQIAGEYREGMRTSLPEELSPEQEETVMEMVREMNEADALETAEKFGAKIERQLDTESQRKILSTLVENLNTDNQNELREILGCESLENTPIH